MHQVQPRPTDPVVPIGSYRTWGTYAASDDVNVAMQNLLEV